MGGIHGHATLGTLPALMRPTAVTLPEGQAACSG